MSYMTEKNLLITSSKDNFIRFWNLKGGAGGQDLERQGDSQQQTSEFDLVDNDYADQIEPERPVYQKPQLSYTQTSSKKPQEQLRNDDPLSKQSLKSNTSQPPVSHQQPKSQQPPVPQKPQQPESDEEDDLAGWND
jgi:hypothetical protein